MFDSQVVQGAITSNLDTDLTVALVVLTALGILVSVLLSTRRQKKVLDWMCLGEEPIVKENRLFTDLTFSWQGQTLKAPRLLRIRIRNTGKETVTAEDFVKPVVIHLTTEYSFLGPKAIGVIVAKKTGGSDPTLTVLPKGDGWEMTPMLFNRGESIDLWLVVDATRKVEGTVACHFKGQSRLMRRTEKNPLKRIAQRGSFWAQLIGAPCGLVFYVWGFFYLKLYSVVRDLGLADAVVFLFWTIAGVRKAHQRWFQ